MALISIAQNTHSSCPLRVSRRLILKIQAKMCSFDQFFGKVIRLLVSLETPHSLVATSDYDSNGRMTK